MPPRLLRGQTQELSCDECNAVLAAAGMRAGNGRRRSRANSATACRTARGRVRAFPRPGEPAPQANAGDRAARMSPTRRRRDRPHVIEPGNSAAGAPTHANRSVKSFFKQEGGRARPAAGQARAGRSWPWPAAAAARQQQHASARWQTGARRAAGHRQQRVQGQGSPYATTTTDHPWRVARGAARHGQRSPAWGTAGTSRPAASEGARRVPGRASVDAAGAVAGAAHQAGRPPKIRAATKHRRPSPRRPTTTRATVRRARPRQLWARNGDRRQSRRASSRRCGSSATTAGTKRRGRRASASSSTIGPRRPGRAGGAAGQQRRRRSRRALRGLSINGQRVRRNVGIGSFATSHTIVDHSVLRNDGFVGVSVYGPGPIHATISNSTLARNIERGSRSRRLVETSARPSRIPRSPATALDSRCEAAASRRASCPTATR